MPFKCFSWPMYEFHKLGVQSRLSGSTMKGTGMKHTRSPLKEQNYCPRLMNPSFFLSFKMVIEVLSIYFPTEVTELYY